MASKGRQESYNGRAHVPNDIQVHNRFIAAKDLTTQANMM